MANADDTEPSYLMLLYNKALINQGLVKIKLIIVTSMPSELCVIGNYAVLNLTLGHHYKRAAT